MNLEVRGSVKSIALTHSSSFSFSCRSMFFGFCRSPSYMSTSMFSDLAHMSACPKRDRDNNFPFLLNSTFPYLIRTPLTIRLQRSHHGVLNLYRVLTQAESNRGTLPSWLDLTLTTLLLIRILLGPIQPRRHASFSVHRTRASPSWLCLAQNSRRPQRTSPLTLPHCVEPLNNCSPISLNFFPFLCTGSLSSPWVNSRTSRCHVTLSGILLTRSWCFHELSPAVCFLCVQFVNCSSLQTFAAHFCEADIQVPGLLWHQFQSCTALLLLSLVQHIQMVITRLCWTLSVLHNTPRIHWRWLRMCLISVTSASHAVGCPKVFFCWKRCFLRSDLRFSLQILLHTRLCPSFHWRKFTLGSLDLHRGSSNWFGKLMGLRRVFVLNNDCHTYRPSPSSDARTDWWCCLIRAK